MESEESGHEESWEWNVTQARRERKGHGDTGQKMNNDNTTNA